MTYNFSGKIAAITGAGGEICGEIAKVLAAEGVSVAIWDIKKKAAKRAYGPPMYFLAITYTLNGVKEHIST